MIDLVAFAGYARVGKDEASAALVDLGYTRTAFGSIIKREVDHLIQRYFGFSAFTEKDDEKALIRGVLESWGDACYDRINDELFRTLPRRAVNARIVRIKEAREWVNRGGAIIELQRPGFGPATDWERDRLDELRASGLITHTIVASDKDDLRAQVVQFVRSGSPALQLAA